MVAAADLKFADRKVMWVRFPPRAHEKIRLSGFLSGPGAKRLSALRVGIEKAEHIFEELCSEKM